MQEYVLSPRLKSLFRLCFISTPVVIAAYLVFFLFVVFLTAVGSMEQSDRPLELGAYFAGSLLVACGAVMATYAIGYVVQLWRAGHRTEALKGLAALVVLNVLAGYIWFYMSEVEGKGIRFKVM